MNGKVRIEACPPDEQRAGLILLFGEVSAADRVRQAEQALERARQGKMSLDGLVIARTPDGLAGAILGMASAGRAVLGWPPRLDAAVPADERPAILRELLTGLVDFGRARSARILQLLLNEKDEELADALTDCRFRELTRLIYLKRDPREELAAFDVPGLELVSYEPALHADFLSVLEQSYEGSQDCPELTGIRLPQEIFESHQAQGEFDPSSWWLARWHGEWAGCLLLVGLPELDAMEIAYVATLPAARGRGIGPALVAHAAEAARATRVRWLTLAVDARNLPARAMYDRHSFDPWDERLAYLRLLDPANGRLDW